MARDQKCKVILVPETVKISQTNINELQKLIECVNKQQMQHLLTDFALESVKMQHLTYDELDQLHVLINFLRNIE